MNDKTDMKFHSGTIEFRQWHTGDDRFALYPKNDAGNSVNCRWCADEVMQVVDMLSDDGSPWLTIWYDKPDKGISIEKSVHGNFVSLRFFDVNFPAHGVVLVMTRDECMALRFALFEMIKDIRPRAAAPR